MFNIFKTHFRTLLAVLLAFVIFSTTTFQVSAKQHYGRAYHAPTVKAVKIIAFSINDTHYVYVASLPAEVPTILRIPAPPVSYGLYVKNEAKPDNLNYQPIKWRSLGLIDAQRNI